MPDVDVAIVGGGLAGLYAAHLLHLAGVDFQLLEARERLGGRILSVDERSATGQGQFDLGPSWFWPGMHPEMAAIVAKLDLAIFPQQTEGDVLIERSASVPPERYPGQKQEPPSMRIAGGTGALVKALADTIPKKRIQLGYRVRHLALADYDVVVSTRRSDEEDFTLNAAYVIAAVPPRLMAETIDFEPALPRDTLQRWRRTPTWMAPHAKLVAVYDQPFWRDAGLSGTAQSMVGPLSEIHDATTATGKPALFGFVEVEAKDRIAAGEAAVKRAAIGQLVRIFGSAAGAPQSALYKDWALDLLTATAEDANSFDHPVGGGSWIDRSWGHRFVPAGSEVSLSFAGYLAGAIEAAGHAAARVSAALAVSSTRCQ